MVKTQVRNVALPVAIREAPVAGGPNRLIGYAAKFGVESEPLFDPSVGMTPFVEVIRAGAFTRTLRENPDIRALYNHDTSIVLGRTKSGTLVLTQDQVGLAFNLILPDTQAAKDIKAMIARGDIDGCSFGFEVVDDVIERREDGSILRTLVDVNLVEISPAVAFPAYSSTAVSLRSRPSSAGTPRLELARRRLRLLDVGR